MTHSLLRADRRAHLKIVAVALVGAAVVIMVGLTARLPDATIRAVQPPAWGPVLKAGGPMAVTDLNATFMR
jgi:hypothetical protein